MREKRQKRAGRGPSSRAPRVSLAPKTAFPFPFIRLPRRLDQTVKKLIAFRGRKLIACHSKLSILNNAGVMLCAKESRMRVLMESPIIPPPRGGGGLFRILNDGESNEGKNQNPKKILRPSNKIQKYPMPNFRALKITKKKH